jgi:hypothetical protein
MTPEEFLRTVYLGDRGCKSILIDGWNSRLVLEVTTISRIRSASGNWEYYADEDIPDGRIVFTGLKSIRWTPQGPVPNDFINYIRAAAVDGHPASPPSYRFTLSISAGTGSGTSAEVIIEIDAEAVHIEDPKRPGEVIST